MSERSEEMLRDGVRRLGGFDPTDDNWLEVFGYANGDKGQPTGVLGFAGTVSPVEIEDVEVCYAYTNGERDERPWVGLFGLFDGRYLAIRASCDYTGWGCQESGEAQLAGNLLDIVRMGLTEGERNALGIVVAGDDVVLGGRS